MNKIFIRQLNRLNQQFYQRVATSFSDSRSYYWQGWNKLVPYLKELSKDRRRHITVLDIGCGNGRFGSFLAQQLQEIKIKYIGIDNSEELLKIAHSQSLSQNINFEFIKLDIIEALLDGSLEKKLQSLSPHFIMALGMVHHIPSFKLRQNFLSQLAHVLSQPGYLAFTTWNFLDTKRFQKKIVNPNQVNIDPQKLEKHDVILDWKRGETAYRYCHYADHEELQALVQTAQLEQVSQFKADSKSGKLNTYTILKK
ncbi:class I SAM-dependent methyltransferase [Patescibacteria group bacterium]|nr:class I SAM-dependent methyltransferase [Patescibacteria group bacterium]